MADAITEVTIVHGAGQTPASVVNRLALHPNASKEAIARLGAELAGIAGGVRSGKVSVRVDSSTDTSAAATQTVTFGSADIVADDTVSVGGVTFTWKASAASQDEITLSTTEATAATNFAAAVNAHTDLQGLISASVATAVVTLTWLGAPRVGEHITLARTETNGGSVTLGAATLVSSATLTVGSTTTRVYPGGSA